MIPSDKEKVASFQNKFHLHHAGLIAVVLLLVAEKTWFPGFTALKYILGFLGVAAIALNLVHIRRLAKQFDSMADAVRQTTQAISIAATERTSFYDSMPDAIITIKSEDNTIIVFSKGAEKMFGYLAHEVMGKNVNMLMPEPYYSEHDAYVKNYIDTGVKKIIGRIRVVKALKRNGEVFDIDLSVSESVLPAGRVFNAIIRDITAKVRAERALEEKNRELEKWNSYERSYGEVMTLFGSTYNEKEILDGTLSRLAEIHPFPVSAIYLYDEWSGKLKCAASHGAPRSLKMEISQGDGLIGQAALEKKRLLVDKGINKEIQLDIETGI
ncbi:MAG: PAS domain S-box protein, partial [Sedimentisphaerales bacterium]|nr:PAS domain S-box protein [Sedimentisphaerales bacterium]